MGKVGSPHLACPPESPCKAPQNFCRYNLLVYLTDVCSTLCSDSHPIDRHVKEISFAFPSTLTKCFLWHIGALFHREAQLDFCHCFCQAPENAAHDLHLNYPRGKITDSQLLSGPREAGWRHEVRGTRGVGERCRCSSSGRLGWCLGFCFLNQLPR